MTKKDICMICDNFSTVHKCDMRNTCGLMALCDENERLKKENKRLRAELSLERVTRWQRGIGDANSQRSYLLGNSSGLKFDTGYVPSPSRYFFDNAAEVMEKDNHVVMSVFLANDARKMIYMSVGQAKIIIELLQEQIDRLGGNK